MGLKRNRNRDGACAGGDFGTCFLGETGTGLRGKENRMKQIRRGKGPSAQSGALSVVLAVFGVVWTVFTLRMGAGFLALFGVFFVVFAVMQAVYHLSNAAGKRRDPLYEIVDTEEAREENAAQGKPPAPAAPSPIAPPVAKAGMGRYCPYCGEAVQADFAFCAGCGRKLPD